MRPGQESTGQDRTGEEENGGKHLRAGKWGGEHVATVPRLRAGQRAAREGDVHVSSQIMGQSIIIEYY